MLPVCRSAPPGRRRLAFHPDDVTSRPLRIALFTGNYVHIEDGVSRTLGRLVGYLLGQGHEVLVCGPTVDEPPMTQPGRFLAIPSVPFPGRSEYRISTRFPASARREVEAFRPDIVHIATPDVLGFRALFWARSRGLPVVATYHTHFVSYLDYYGIGRARPLFHAIARQFYNRCAEVYVPTPTMEASLRHQGVTIPVRLWPRGIELDRFSPASRSESWRDAAGFSHDDVVFAFVSRLVKEKGVDVYAETVTRLRREGLPVRALVVGDGPEREALGALLPDATFTGHLHAHDLSVAYASSDVFLFPSETETFGNVTLEAMASGLCCICADAAGSKSLIEDDVTGILCPPRNAEAFARAGRAVVADADRRRHVGAAARVAAMKYSWPVVLERMEDFYFAVVANRRKVSQSKAA